MVKMTMRDLLPQLTDWLTEGKPVATATVVSTWGSSPRQPGAKLAVTPPHAMIGSVSGGCVEGAVIDEAVASLNDYTPRLLHFGVADEAAWDVGLACGGEMDVYVEPLDAALAEVLAQRTADETTYAVATVVSGGALGTKVVVDAAGLAYAVGDPDALDLLTFAALTALHSGQTARTTADDYDVFIEVVQPRPRLIVVGGAHVAQPLTQMAQMLGFRVSLIDPRSAFASAARFSHVSDIHHTYPDKALEAIGLDAHSYVVVLSHDPKIDDPALRLALPSPAPYIGVLSSRKTHAKRVERLTAAGIPAEQLARIFTPIGLDIGAVTPEEIAVGIMAEIIAVRRGKSPL